MAILIEKKLSISGITVPAGTLVKPNVHFPADILSKDAAGKLQHKRVITYDNVVYASLESFQNLGTPVFGISAIPAGSEKYMTDEEFTALMAKGELAEVWLKDILNTALGGNYCSIIDPYA